MFFAARLEFVALLLTGPIPVHGFAGLSGAQEFLQCGGGGLFGLPQGLETARAVFFERIAIGVELGEMSGRSSRGPPLPAQGIRLLALGGGIANTGSGFLFDGQGAGVRFQRLLFLALANGQQRLQREPESFHDVFTFPCIVACNARQLSVTRQPS